KEANGIEKGSITISLSCKNNQEIIEVSDNGGGIDVDIIDFIFEPYYTTKFHAKGTGIGLYIAKNIIEIKMKGFLSVKNIEFGSCFTIALPLLEEQNI
ncbi:MAG: HAMP domain-containing sensor histidine kinase, partial [Campylobacterota bacterium]|nr:HAMP domain-containing sensor histidine kinase [Campylobacterota bacterium]